MNLDRIDKIEKLSLEFRKKFRTYKDPDEKPPALQENFVNSVNSVYIKFVC